MFVFDTDNRLICAATMVQTFAFFGEEGARAQAQRHKVLKRHVRDLRTNTVRLDLVQVIGRRTTLVDAAPGRVCGAAITLTPEMSRLLQAASAQQIAQAQQAVRREPPITSQWQTPPNAWLSSSSKEAYDDDIPALPFPDAGSPVSGGEQ